MTINIALPNGQTNLRPRITVIGVGGAGGNAVNNMINSNLEGVDFLVTNTDAQALENSLSEKKESSINFWCFGLYGSKFKK